ncbi:hypothetical protein DB032_21180 [Chromobacterium sp. Panama]|uniref:hypothetical protein n=1 Tax=Chromobacterium sp. Panama TaxID=2161826 RepID=UPI000D305D09|nr:hypothetical protein [Chromobacterium sp. Panama]PTU67259.1 hypothetical protein DB032_21180 [Chromobacterium sp. Panama]
MLKAILLSSLLLSALPAWAGLSQTDTASEKISVGTLSIVAAPAISVAGSAQGKGESLLAPVLAVTGSAYVITGLAQGAGDTVKMSLDAVQGGAKLVVELSGKALKATGAAVGAAVGASVQVTAVASGTMLVTSGKVLAFIPNKLGEALLEHNRVPS